MNRHLRRAVLWYSIRNRQAKAEVIRKFMLEEGISDVVFVGCSPGSNPNELIVERAVASDVPVLAAVDMLSCTDLPWPFVQADGRTLPFASNSADMILAQAVVEHVGDRPEQESFIAEQSRVARGWVITTPNKWFPMESHTAVLFLHWWPAWRRGRTEFTRLLSRREFRALLPPGTRVVGRPWSATFSAFYVGRGASTPKAPTAV